MNTIYDTKADAEIIAAREALVRMRDDFRSLVRSARIDKGRAAAALAAHARATNPLASVTPEGATTDAAPRDDIPGAEEASQPDFRTQATEGHYEMWFYDAIDPIFGISANQVLEALREADEAGLPVLAHINSPGGVIDDSRAIHTMLTQHAVKMGNRGVSIVEGLAASAATTISLGNPVVQMARGTQFMVHRCWAAFHGNANDLEAIKEVLAKVDRNMADDYALKAGITRARALSLMDKETFLNADEALSLGLIDSIHDGDATVPAASEPAPKARDMAAARRRAEAQLQFVDMMLAHTH